MTPASSPLHGISESLEILSHSQVAVLSELEYNTCMRRRLKRIALGFVLFAALCSPIALSQETIEPVTIATGEQNIRPVVSYNKDDNQFLVVWIRTNEVISYSQSSIHATILSADFNLQPFATQKISRPSLKKVQAPFVAAKYNPAVQKYLIIWQEIDGTDRTLYLTSLDQLGAFVNRTSVLDEQQGVLLTAPLLANQADSEYVIAVWSELVEGGSEMTAMIFHADAPHFRIDPRYVIPPPGKRFELPMVLSGTGSTFSIYGFLADRVRGSNRLLFVKELNMATGLEFGRTTVTRRKVRTSMTISAADGIEGDLLLYNQSFPLLNLSSLSIFNFDRSAEIKYRPTAFTPPGVFAFEGLLLDPAVDGYNKLIWIKEDNDRFSLLLQSVTPTGDLIDDAMEIYSSRFPISMPAAVYGNDNASLLVIWSADNRKNEINLEGTLLDMR